MNSKTNRGFTIPILIIVTLLILAVIAYFFSPKSISLNLPASMSTLTPKPEISEYISKSYSFQLDIPSDWEARKDKTGYVESEDNVEESLKIAPKNFKEGYYGSIDIRTDKFNSVIEAIQKKISDYNKYITEVGGENKSTFLSNKRDKFNGYEATILRYKTGLVQDEYIIVSRNNFTYVIFRPFIKGDLNYESASQILSTFKFIE